MIDKPRVYLARTPQYRDRIRAYRVFLDHAEIGKISNGASLNFDLEPGDHQLMLKIDWCTSNTFRFRAKPGEDIYLECGNNLSTDWNPMSILRAIGAVTVARDTYLYIKWQR